MKEKKGNNNPDPVTFPPLTPNTPPEINDPPVPNRAHTEMRLATELDTLSEVEKAQLYFKKTSLE